MHTGIFELTIEYVQLSLKTLLEVSNFAEDCIFLQ